MQESLWFLPGVMTLGGAVLALGLVQLDALLELDRRAGHVWAFGGGAAGARGVLQAIAGSLITVTATIFSITIVTLQLASTQFTPRVLRTFTRDRGVQLVFGIFIGTFTYSLLVLRAVRSQEDDFELFVPSISVLGAILLALICVGFLIYFIHHVAQMIRVPAVVERVVWDGERLIDRRYPAGIADPAAYDEIVEPAASVSPWVVTASSDGYLLSIDADRLFALSHDAPLTIRLEPLIGAFILRGEPLATVWPGAREEDDVTAAIRSSCRLGTERTLEADVALPIRQLADIAIKALSPGINDPTTATMCIDRLAQLLLRAAQRGEPPGAFRRSDSAVCLMVRSPSFELLAETAFAQIRHFGADDPEVGPHLLTILERLAPLVPPAERAIVRRHAESTRAGLSAR